MSPGARRAPATAALSYLPAPRSAKLEIAGSDVNQGAFPMIFVGPFVRRLCVLTAYVAFAFVGAIVLGVF
jgi:hypothetical protein